MTPKTTFANGVNCFTGVAAAVAKNKMARNPPRLGYDQVRLLKEQLAGGVSYVTLAEFFGVSRQTLSNAANSRGTYAGY